MATASICSLLSLSPSTGRFPAAPSSSQLPPTPSHPPLSLRCGRGSESLPIIATGSPSCLSFQAPSPAFFPSFGGSAICRMGTNVLMVVDDDEPEESMVRRFRSMVLRSGIMQECKRRRFYETKQEERKRKSRDAARKNRTRRFQPRGRTPYEEEALQDAEDDDFDDSEDNWEMLEGDIPF